MKVLNTKLTDNNNLKTLYNKAKLIAKEMFNLNNKPFTDDKKRK